MKFKHTALPLFFAAVALTGCSSSVPECSDKETVNLVKKIAADELARQLGEAIRGKVSLAVSAIRTTEINEQTGARACAAQLDMYSTQPDKKNATPKQVPITYTVENTDKGDEFYVNVFGL